MPALLNNHLSLYAFLLLNVITFLVYGFDKIVSTTSMRRVPELTLLFLAFIGGAYGAGLGMVLFHHKVRKLIFRTCIPAFILLWTVLIIYLKSAHPELF